MKIKAFNQENLKEVRLEINSAMKAIEIKYSIKIDLEGISYTDDEFSSKIQATIVTEGENPQESKDKLSLKKNGHYYNLTVADYGREITLSNGEIGKIVAVKVKSPKYPIIYTVKGKRYKTTETVISRMNQLNKK